MIQSIRTNPATNVDDVKLPRLEIEVPNEGTRLWVLETKYKYKWVGNFHKRKLKAERVHLTKERANAWDKWWNKKKSSALDIKESGLKNQNIRPVLLYDDLGYFRSYTSKCRAEQAIKSLDSKKRGKWSIIDSLDKYSI